jgi:regulatory protein
MGGGKTEAQALRLLARRPCSEAEMRSRLLESGFDPQEVAAAIEGLRERRLLDDEALALLWVTVRAPRLGRGPVRLIEELVDRGVDRAVAEAAWDRAVREGDLDPVDLLRKEAERRIAAEGGRLEGRRYARVYNALLRAGFEPEAIRAALAPARSVPDDPAKDAASEYDDDIA